MTERLFIVSIMEIISKFALISAVAVLSAETLGLDLDAYKALFFSAVSSLTFSIFDAPRLYYFNAAVVFIVYSTILYRDRFKTTVLFFIVSYVIYIAIEYFVSRIETAVEDALYEILAAATVTALWLIIKGLKLLYRRYFSSRRTTYKIELINGGTTAFSKGFLDNGNVATHDGVPIVFIEKRLAEKVKLEPVDTTAVMTVAGLKAIKIAPVKLKLYYDDASDETFDVVAAISDIPVRQPVLLNSSMRR